MALRTIGVKLTADVSGYVSGMRRAAESTKSFSQNLSQKAASGHLDAIADRAGIMGIAVGGAFAYAVKSAADFDKQMSAVSAATHASTGDMDKLRAAALQAGKDTQYSATQAAQGITELSKAGVSTADVLGGGLKGALSLAAAGQIDVGEAAETAASAMTQFKLKGDQVPHVADLLAAAAGKAQGSVHDMGAALNQTGLVASQAGLSIEDTTGTLAAFAKAGLIGSDAGTSFKTMLLAIQNPSKESAALMKDLGISAYDAQGNFVGISKFAGILKERLSGLTPQVRQQAMAQIFGNDAVRAANVLYEQGNEGIQKWIGNVNEAGYASDTAAKLTDNLAGDIERLKGSLETMAIEGGSGANSGLRVITKSLGALVDGFGQLPPVVGSTITVLAGLGAAVLLGGAGWVKMRSSVANTVTELRAVGPVGAKAATALETTGKAAGRAGAAFAALQVIGAIASSFQTELNPQIDAATLSLTSWNKQCLLSGEAARIFGADSSDLDRALNGLASHGFSHATDAVTDWVFGLGGVSSPLDDAKIKAAALDETLAAMVKSGHGSEALGYLEQRSKSTGKSVDELKKLLPGYSAALETTGAAGKKAGAGADAAAGGMDAVAGAAPDATGATTEYKTAADAAAAAARGQRTALTDLANKMRAETDPVFGLLDAENQLTEAQKKATEAVKKHKAGSVEAKEATRNLALAAINLQEKAGALGSTFNGKMTPALYKTLTAAGLTDGQIKDVAKQFRQAKADADKYDGNYAANVSAPGAKDTDAKIQALWKKLKNVDGTWTADVRVGKSYSDTKAKLLGLIAQQYKLQHPTASGSDVSDYRREIARAMATGGPVYGAGTSTSDSIPARLSVGEHVWTADEVQKLGGQRSVMTLRAAVSAGKRVEIGDETPGFARGGGVMPFPVSTAGTKYPSIDMFPTGSAGSFTGGGMTYPWILAAVHAAFPGMHAISTFRRGARTLSGNRSYHSVGRAVDWPPSKPLAEWINANYFRQTRELITPWNSLNIHNGQRHTYTGAIYRQHNFAGGNAHDHWAMANGGVINEPVVGVGASGRTYSFGEYGPETVMPGTKWLGGGDGGSGSFTANYNITVEVPANANMAEVGRVTVDAIKQYERRSGTSWRKG